MGSWAAIERHVVEGGPGDSQVFQVCQGRPLSWEGAGEAVIAQHPAASQEEVRQHQLRSWAAIERHDVNGVPGGEGLSVPSTQREAVGERLSEGGRWGSYESPQQHREKTLPRERHITRCSRPPSPIRLTAAGRNLWRCRSHPAYRTDP